MNFNHLKLKLKSSWKLKASSVEDESSTSSLLTVDFNSPNLIDSKLKDEPETVTTLFEVDHFDPINSPPKPNSSLGGFDLKAPQVIGAKGPTRGEVGDLLGDLDLSQPTGTWAKTGLAQSTATPEFDNFFTSQLDLQLGEVAINPETDEFGDFFASSSQPSFSSTQNLTEPFKPVESKASRRGSKVLQLSPVLSSSTSSAHPSLINKLKDPTNDSNRCFPSHQPKESSESSDGSEFATGLWADLIHLALNEFSTALTFLNELDKASTPKDRQLFAAYPPLSVYIEGLFNIHLVMDRLRFSAQTRPLAILSESSESDLCTKWTNLRNLLRRLAIPEVNW